MTDKTALTMLAEALTAHGYDGLVKPDAECGCEVSDLAPCSGDFGACRPGYKHMTGSPVVWLMCVSKDATEQSDFDAME
jgi:hypothetical protein